MEAFPILKLKQKKLFQVLNSIDFNEVCITSSIKLILDEGATSNGSLSIEDSVEVEIIKAEGEKCERCWKYTNSYTNFKDNIICQRCNEVLENL